MSVLLGCLGIIGEGAALARKQRQWGQGGKNEEGDGGGLEGGDHRETGGQEWSVLAPLITYRRQPCYMHALDGFP